MQCLTHSTAQIPSHRPPVPEADLFSQNKIKESEVRSQNSGLRTPDSGQPDRVVTDADPRIDAMLAFLRGRGWVNRTVVFHAIGVSDRGGRALKAASGGLVISDSQHGYKHILDAAPDEFRHAENEIRSRIEELEKYLRNMQHVFNGEREAA